MFSESEEELIAKVDLKRLAKASFIYDDASDTLHIQISNEEPDETVMLENDIIVRLKSGLIVELAITGIKRFLVQ